MCPWKYPEQKMNFNIKKVFFTTAANIMFISEDKSFPLLKIMPKTKSSFCGYTSRHICQLQSKQTVLDLADLSFRKLYKDIRVNDEEVSDVKNDYESVAQDCMNFHSVGEVAWENLKIEFLIESKIEYDYCQDSFKQMEGKKESAVGETEHVEFEEKNET